MKQSFKIFVINLPIDVARRHAIESRLNSLGSEYEVSDGIYGDDERVVARYDEVKAIKEHGKPMTRGEKGCALAHAIVYEKMIKENIEYALILEDDIVLPDNFLKIVEREVQKPNKKWDWLSFDYRNIGFNFLKPWFYANYIRIKQNPWFFFYAFLKTPYIVSLSMFELVRDIFARKIHSYAGAKRFYRPLFNAGAYVLTLEGAKKLIPYTDSICMGADTLPNKARFRTKFNLLGYVPLIVRQNLEEFGSNTIRSDDDWNKININHERK